MAVGGMIEWTECILYLQPEASDNGARNKKRDEII